MPPGPRRAACLVAASWALALAACTAEPRAFLSSGLSSGLPRCQLPAPLVSDDTCAVTADCAVSSPCHATACVGKAKAHPAAPDTQCTMNLVCNSADANRCDCFQGRCALLPPS